jgi:hypothetical protein
MYIYWLQTPWHAAGLPGMFYTYAGTIALKFELSNCPKGEFD